jgi:transcriptional regulator with XRE-family HTH domain
MTKDAGMGRLEELIRAARLPRPERCRLLRVEAGLTLREAAAYIGVAPMTLLRWERGDARPHRQRALKYRAFLDRLERALEEAPR